MIISNDSIILENDHDRQLIWDALYCKLGDCYENTQDKYKGAIWYNAFKETLDEYDKILEECYEVFTGILH